MNLDETLRRADGRLGDIWDAIKGPMTICDHRSQIALAYLSLVLEHQESIVTLIRNHLRGSALALVRPVFELFYRTFWMTNYATPADVEKIWNDRFDFPKVATMAEDIDKIVGGSQFKNIKMMSWRDQNELAHSGGFQIRSRFTRGTLESSYPDDIMIGSVNSTMLVVLMLAVLILRTHDRISDAEPLEALIPEFQPS